MIINRQYFENSLQFDNEKTDRILLMYDIAKSISNDNKNLILKGGTALLFCFGLPRFSTDLDYDGIDYNFNINDNITNVFKNNNLELSSLNTKKDTDTVKRFMVHYKEAENNPIKIEISFRNMGNGNIFDNKININGLNTYNIKYLANNKINTFLDRMAARDIFDTAYLFKQYPDVINKDLIEKCKNKLNTIGIDQFEKIIKSDAILKDFDTDEILINFDKNINNLSSKKINNTNTEKSRSRSI